MPILRSLVSSILHPALCVSDFPKRSLKGNKNRPADSDVNVDTRRLSGKMNGILPKVYNFHGFAEGQNRTIEQANYTFCQGASKLNKPSP